MNESDIEVDQEMLAILQPLMEPCDRQTYGQRLREASEKSGRSVRTVQRWMKRWQQEGIQAFSIRGRADVGRPRIDQEWQDFIVKTFEQGNRGGKRMSVAQVAVRVKVKAQQEGLGSYPSRATVFRILNPILEKKEERKSLRSPGWRGSRLALKTRDGKELAVEYSNQVWQCDHTRADVLLVDDEGKLLDRPWLTTVVDSYSRCIMGIHLGFDAPSSHLVSLALRHAILPKTYGEEFGLHCEWGTYGVPQYFYTDGGKDFRSEHLQQIGAQLGFTCHLRRRPSDGGLVERPFRTLNTQLFATLPGYTGSNVQERPKEAEREARLTLKDLERLIVGFLVDTYNQTLDARMGDQTRFQRWEAGLPAVPHLPTERELDLCLMKSTQRRVQRGGYIQFESLFYRGENLAGYEGSQVSLRYDPADITTVWVYRFERGQEVFLTQAHAQGLEVATISLHDAKTARRQLRETQQSVTNHSVLAEVERRQIEEVTSKRARRKQAQADLKPRPVEPDPLVEDEEVVQAEVSVVVTPVKVWDLDEEI